MLENWLRGGVDGGGVEAGRQTLLSMWTGSLRRGGRRHIFLAYAKREEPMSSQRHVRLFRNGRNQAVRIPVEFELPGDEAIMHRDGDRLVIEPVRKRGLVALLKSMTPLDEAFPEIDDPAPKPEPVL